MDIGTQLKVRRIIRQASGSKLEFHLPRERGR